MGRRSKSKIRRGAGSPASTGSVAGQNRQTSSPDARFQNHWLSPAICLFLAAIVWAVFGQTLQHGFVNFDDSSCVYENPPVMHGLSRTSFVWAFTQPLNGNWIPLTTLSHMLDCQLYGLKAGSHHLTSVLLHAATAILLFLFLQNLTRATWRSAFVAAVFAIHPLRVESVAWIAERKDVLSGLFFVLTLWAYVRYARQQGFENRNVFSCFRSFYYWLALLLFALGLMSKPMLVTLPFVLLLLDYWPLNRLSSGAPEAPRSLFHIWLRLGLEKIPFLLLTVADCVATILVQSGAKAMQFGEHIRLVVRISNALVSYAVYLWQMVYPGGLAIFYPHPRNQLYYGMAGLSVLVLLIISVGVVAGRRKHPYWLAGWLWYLGMLVPVIGLIQVGGQARADRYTYLPQIGLYLMAAWGAVELCGGWRWRRIVLGSVAVAILAGLLAGAYAQTMHWKDSVSLWTHALASTSDNFMTQYTLGKALASQGKPAEAIPHYERALEFKPDDADVFFNLGSASADQGKLAEAVQHYERALELKPDYVDAHNNLGFALARQGKLAEAVQHYERALQLKPDDADACNNLGNALAGQGKLAEAIQQFQQALQFKPDDAHAHNNFGSVLARQGKSAEAMQHYERALELEPDFAEAHNNLGLALAAQGKVAEAIQHFERALQLKPDNAQAHYSLGLALAGQGKMAEATEHLQQALKLATARNQTALAELIRNRLKSLQSSLPQPHAP